MAGSRSKEMRLVIGGYAQGKFSYVMERYGTQDAVVLDEITDVTHASQNMIVVNHFHKWMKCCLEKGRNPELMIDEFLEKNPTTSRPKATEALPAFVLPLATA